MQRPRPPRPGKYELPGVISTLRNFSNFVGEQSSVPTGLARAGYQIGGIGLDEVHGVIRWGIDDGIGFIVGHYNPAEQEWQIFPECVPNKMQAKALSTEMQYKLPSIRREALDKGRLPGGSFVDLHDPATHKAREILAQQLAPLRPMEFAQNESVQEALCHADLLHYKERLAAVSIDESTFCFPTLGIQTTNHEHIESVGVNDTITTSEIALKPESLLTLCYTGLIVQTQDSSGRMRAIRHVPIARNDPDLGWTANTDVVTAKQWDILQPITHTLTEMAHNVPRFSPLYSSIVYGQPGLESLQWRA